MFFFGVDNIVFYFLTVLLSIIIYLFYKTTKYSYLKRFGYSGPKPSLLRLGNLSEFNSKSNSINNSTSSIHYSKTLYKWSSQYGKIYGYYEVTKPVLVIADADLVKQIFIGNKLQYRRSFPMSKKSDEKDADLFINNGERWQRVRRCIEKIFSNKTNLTTSNSHLNDSFKSVFSTIETQNKKSRIDIYKKIKTVLIQTMFQSIFGVPLAQHYQSINDSHYQNVRRNLHDINSINNELSEHLVDKFDSAFVDFESVTVLKLCSLVFDEFDCLWRMIDRLKRKIYDKYDFKTFENPMLWFNKYFTVRQYNLRNEQLNDEKHQNLFNLVSSSSINISNCYLTNDEVISNASLLMFAGFETTATAITFACHIIATNKVERRRLVQEIHNCVRNSNSYSEESNKDSTFELIDKLKYLDLFVREVLRMYPIANSMVSRKCVQDDIYIGKYNEHFIPKGMNIVVDVLSIHYDRELWGPVDPFVFYPNRFLVNRHPAAWLAFGVGKRKCLGMKMALNHMKLALINILKNYTLEREICDYEGSSEAANMFNFIDTKEVLFNVPFSNNNFLIEHY